MQGQYVIGNCVIDNSTPSVTRPKRLAPTVSFRWEMLDVDELLVEMVDIAKSFPGVRALENAQFDLRRGRGARSRRGERRGEVHPDEDPGRDLSPRCGRDPDPRRGTGDHLPPGGPGPRDQHHPPGAEPDGPPDGGPEHLHRPGAAPRAPARREGAQPEDRGAVRGSPHPAGSAHARVPACRGTAADGRDREGAVLQLGRPGHGRADRGAHRHRDRRAVPDHPPPPGAGPRDRPHLAPARRAQADHRPGHGHARRALHQDGGHGRGIDPGDHQHDGRPDGLSRRRRSCPRRPIRR